MPNLDDDEFNEDEFDKQMEEFEKESKKFNQFFDKGFEWLNLYQNMLPILCRFIKNTEGIEHVIHHLPNKDDSTHEFLIATLMGGAVSAYEGMVHDLVNLLMSNSNYKKEKNIQKIKDEDLQRLRIKKTLPWNEFAKKLGNATLNHPNLVARILNALFEFNIPEGNEDEINALIGMRNDFTHNNGINKEGKVYQISWGRLGNFLTKMDKLVADYMNNIQLHVDEFLKKSPVEAHTDT